MKGRKQFIFMIAILLLTACGPSSEGIATQTAAAWTPTPTNTLKPTATNVPPTNTPEPPTVTPLPEGLLFRDDFEVELQPEWEWINEDPDRWSLTSDGWLEIQSNNPGFFNADEDFSMVNVLVQPAPAGDFVLSTHLRANPDENFQQAGIFLIHDQENYVSVLSAFCEPCVPDSNGFGFAMEAFKDGEYISNGMYKDRAPEETDVYLRLVYSSADATVTGFYAVEPDQWQIVGVIKDFPTIQKIALGTANLPGPAGVEKDLVASFDYLEISIQKPDKPESSGEDVVHETTPLPEGIIFRDDFDGYFQPGWEWMNENPDRWSFVEFGDSTWLKIIGDDSGNFIDQVNTLVRELPEGDFMITTHVIANPRVNHHQANIFLFENAQNYIRMNFGYCDHCGLPEGYGFFMETIIENNPFGDVYAIPRAAEDTDVYLRLVNQGGSITGYYATEYGDWQRIGAFGNYFEFVSVGLGATNSASTEWNIEDIEALFDYFEIALPE